MNLHSSNKLKLKLGDIVSTKWDDVPDLTGIVVALPDEDATNGYLRAIFAGDTCHQGVEADQIIAVCGNIFDLFPGVFALEIPELG